MSLFVICLIIVFILVVVPVIWWLVLATGKGARRVGRGRRRGRR